MSFMVSLLAREHLTVHVLSGQRAQTFVTPTASIYRQVNKSVYRVHCHRKESLMRRMCVKIVFFFVKSG